MTTIIKLRISDPQVSLPDIMAPLRHQRFAIVDARHDGGAHTVTLRGPVDIDDVDPIGLARLNELSVEVLIRRAED